MRPSFVDACRRIDTALALRRGVVQDLSRATDFGGALLRLRKRMQINAWEAGGNAVNLAPIVLPFDARTTEEGFHVLRDWDGRADAVLADTIPIDVLTYL